MPLSKISRFTERIVTVAKNAVGGRGEVAAPEGGGGFAEYAVLSLHRLRVSLAKSDGEALDLLSEMAHKPGEVGLEAAVLPDHSTLVKWFDRIKTVLWGVLLGLSAFTNRRFVRTQDRSAILGPKSTTRADTLPLPRRSSTVKPPANTTAVGRITGCRGSKRLRSSTQKATRVWPVTARPRKRHDTQLGWQVARVAAGDLASFAADNGSDWMELREELREDGVRPLINHRGFRPIDHAHNARVDGPRYRQRAMCASVFSTTSAHSATPCVREPGTVNFENSF
jgi:IS5 family transposase